MGKVKLFQKCPHCGHDIEVKKSLLQTTRFPGGIQFFDYDKVIQKCSHCGKLVDIKF